MVVEVIAPDVDEVEFCEDAGPTDCVSRRNEFRCPRRLLNPYPADGHSCFCDHVGWIARLRFLACVSRWQWRPPGWRVIYTLSMRTGRHPGGTMQDHPEDRSLFSDCCTAEIGLCVSRSSDQSCSDTYFCRPYESQRQEYRVRTAHTEWGF